MNTANILRCLNNDFYAGQATSFSATRQQEWPGWRRVVYHIGKLSCERLSILDVASGNMRFERFVTDTLEDRRVEFYCVDSCPELAQLSENVTFIERDVISCLWAEEPLLESKSGTPFDVGVCFGFFHHVPGRQMRKALLDVLLDAVRPGGVVSVAFWRFMSQEKLAEKAELTTREALKELDVTLEVGDYLVGWQGREGVYRYCHHFDEEEIDELVAYASNRSVLIDRYQDDGRSGDLNTYLILERK